MTNSIALRLSLLLGGLAAIGVSFALQSGYPNDPPVVELASPGVTAIVAIAGVVAIGASMIGRGSNK
jgi:hypothetical protein